MKKKQKKNVNNFQYLNVFINNLNIKWSKKIEQKKETKKPMKIREYIC
jgi:hypothetical protein